VIDFIVTKPGAGGAALTRALVDAGALAWHLPAFELGPAPDPAAARALLAQADGFDLVIAVSPAAARGAAALMQAPWPAATRLAGVGRATAQALREAFHLPPERAVIAPPADEDEGSGSEALWQALQPLRPPPRRVLLLRAAQGREWLPQRLRAAGAAVEVLPVYARRAADWASLPAAARAALRAGRAGVVVTSSEAVAAVLAQAAARDSAAALQAAPAVTMHPRVADALRAAGFARVYVVPTLDAPALLALAHRIGAA
jgi:uroporphyrinogen-III synthase